MKMYQLKRLIASFVVLFLCWGVYLIWQPRSKLPEGFDETLELMEHETAELAENGEQFNWYPLYELTPVIAVDRDQCHRPLASWQDLLEGDEVVLLDLTQSTAKFYVMALAYGLSGKMEMEPALAYLRQLWDKDRLLVADRQTDYSRSPLQVSRENTPILLSFSRPANVLRQEGRNLQLIVPQENKLTFTRGLVSKKQLQGLRSSQPVNRVPERAKLQAGADAQPAKLREALYGANKLFLSGGYQYYAAYFILLTLTIYGLGAIRARVLQRAAGLALAGLETVMLSFYLVRLVKMTLPLFYDAAIRLLWYAYYPCFFGGGFFLLWLAWSAGRPVEDDSCPSWLKWLACLNLAVSLLVLTNDWHQLVFKFNPWAGNSLDSYFGGILELPVKALALSEVLAAGGILTYKVVKDRHLGVRTILPLTVLLLLGVYNYGYSLGWHYFRLSETVLANSTGILLFLAAAVYSRTLPTNGNYEAVFSACNLNLQILDRNNRVVFSSAADTGAGKQLVPHSMAINGGRVLWREDVSELKTLQRSLALTTAAMQRSRYLLAYQENIKGAFLALRAQNRLYEQLEEIMSSRRDLIKSALRLLKDPGQPEDVKKRVVSSLNVTACYLKKRCVLLLGAQADNHVPPAELAAAVRELVDCARQDGINCLCLTEWSGSKPDINQALLCFDLVDRILKEAAANKLNSLLLNFSATGKRLRLICLTSPLEKIWLEGLWWQVRQEKNLALLSAQQLYLKDLEDACTLTLEVAKEAWKHA